VDKKVLHILADLYANITFEALLKIRGGGSKNLK
jgi:hypothetical protein